MDLFERNQEQLYKVCLVGDGGVGKSAMLERFFGMGDRFQCGYKPTIGTEIGVKSIVINEIEIKLQIWDIAGQPQFEFARASFYKGSCAIIMVFDLTTPRTLYHLAKWKNEVMANVDRKIPFLVAGNKADLHSTIDHEEIRSFIEIFKYETSSRSLPLLFTSALTGHNIKELFDILGRSILEHVNIQNLPSLQVTF
jgi:small GTP-binding protein